MEGTLQEALESLHPFLFKDEFGNSTCFVEVQDGWRAILETMVKLIGDHIQATNIRVPGSLDENLLQFWQIKEKNGTLRVYFSHSDPFIDGIISFAEEISGRICEISGHPGALCSAESGRILKTLSPEVAKVQGFSPI